MSATLVESSNALISGFSSHPLHAVALRNELLDRANSQEQHQQSALARSTTENLTSYTNLSDGGGYSVDPNDLKRLDNEMELFKTHFSQVKLQWLESNVKRRTLQKLLQANAGEEIITQEQSDAMEVERTKSKQGLKLKKAEAEELKKQIEQVARELDTSLNKQLTPALEEARSLTRSIQDMELELAMLRNSRPENEQMTVDEANHYLDDQVISLQDLAQSLQDNKALITERKQVLAMKQKELEKLSAERASMQKLENEARSAVKNKDRRIEENCRQLADRTSLVASVLGIKEVQPCPNGELRVVYDLGSGKTATLAIYSDVHQRRFTGASLLNSNTSIDDVVQRCLKSGDLQDLVLEVLVRIA